MVEQQSFDYDPQRHAQPPPAVPLRADGLAQAQQARPAAPQPQRQLFTEPLQDVQPAYVKMARQVSIILATRFLLLIGVVTASALWGVTIWRPEELRIIAASCFSVLGVMPLIWIYLKKG